MLNLLPNLWQIVWCLDDGMLLMGSEGSMPSCGRAGNAMGVLYPDCPNQDKAYSIELWELSRNQNQNLQGTREPKPLAGSQIYQNESDCKVRQDPMSYSVLLAWRV